MNHKYIGNDFFGLSIPYDCRVDHQLIEEDIILCDQAEKLIYTDMKQLMPTSDDGKLDHLYLVPPRNKLFLQKNISSPIHANHYETTYMFHVLGVHVDSQNPNIHESLSDSFMNQLVGCFAKKRGQICRLLIGFCRESVVNTVIRCRKFGPCIDSITVFYSKLPDEKIDITTTLVENFNNEVK